MTTSEAQLGDGVVSTPPSLDPQMAKILRRMREDSAGAPKAWEIDIATLRRRARQEFVHWNENPTPVARVQQVQARGVSGETSVRVYYPAENAALPGLIYFHGGGWVLGDLDLEDSALRVLAAESGVAVLSVDYALAPEHPFPIPLEDCVSVSCWLRTHATTLGIDPNRLAMGGASAGANLALATALDLRNQGNSWAKFLLLIQGAYAANFDSDSMREFGDGSFGLSRSMMEYFWRCYVPDPDRRKNPRAAPLRAELAGLAPVYLNAAALDPLLDDSIELRARLHEAGIPVQCDFYPGVIHGFPLFLRELDVARTALRDAARALHTALF